MSRLPVPLRQLDARMPEAGRIRLGVKSGKAMRSIDTMRFTSPDEQVIRELAAQFGGQPQRWRDAKANPPDQWEVITQAKEIPIYLPPGALTTWYELWSGGGVQRRCDGETCQVPVTVPGGWEMSETPCVCTTRKKMECRPYSRLSVIIPTVAFRGVWRIETKGWNAAHELPAVVNLIDMLATTGQYVDAVLYVERRVQQTPGGKRDFVVPGIKLKHSPEHMLAGAAAVAALPSSATLPSTAPAGALGAGAPSTPAPGASADDGIIDADVVETPVTALADQLWNHAAQQRALAGSEQRFVNAVLRQVGITDPATFTDAQLDRIRAALAKLEAGNLTALGFNPDGSVIWRTS